MDPSWIVMIATIGTVMAVVGAAVLISRAMPERKLIEPVLYAKKGEIITCTGGHEICELAEDVYVGGTLIAEQFVNWRNQEAAKPCDVIMPCKTCGEPFIKSVMPYGGNHLHIDGEWRTICEPLIYG